MTKTKTTSNNTPAKKTAIVKKTMASVTGNSTLKGFTIEKNIPIPTRSFTHKYPFGDMGVMDSFFVPEKPPASLMSSSASYLKNNPNFEWKFTARRETKVIDGKEVEGARIWRIQ